MTRDSDFDLSSFLPYLLTQAAEVSSLAFQKTYKDRYGMLRTEWRVLFHLGMYGPMTARDIGERAQMHKTKISRAVAKLEARRFLTRSREDTDRRFERLELTARGRAAFCDLRDEAERYDKVLTGQFSQADVARLRAMLKQLG